MATNPLPLKTSLVWATDTVNDTVSNQPNVVEPSSTMKTDGFSSDQYPPMNWFNYWMNGVGQYVNLLQRSSTYVIASSDSSAASQAGADTVIQSSEDAGVIINAILASMTRHGELKIMEGHYNFDTTLNVQSYINITGCGAWTVLVRNTASLQNVIYIANTVTNVTLKDFKVDGHSLIYTGLAAGIFSQTTQSETVKIVNVISENNKSTDDSAGFSNCHNLDGCATTGNRNSGGNDAGFYQCVDGFCNCQCKCFCYWYGTILPYLS